MIRNKLKKKIFFNLKKNKTNYFSDGKNKFFYKDILKKLHRFESFLKLNNIQELIDSLKNQISVFEVIKFIVSEEGVKSYIVKKILELFNSKLAFYLKKMDANCICVFNEYFEGFDI